MGVEVDLFQMYDWCCSSATPICGSVYWGIELHTGLSSVVDSVDVLQKCVELALDAIVGIEVQQRPEENAVHWVLFCRAVALGGRNRAQAVDSSGPEAAGAGDGDTCVIGRSGNSLTYQRFITIKRDYASAKAARITSARCRVKCVALRCATAAFFGASRHEANDDLNVARRVTQESCDKLVGNVPVAKILSEVPAYLPLFINDMVTFACACASYAIEDKPQVSLQTEAVQLLQGIIVRFGDSLDPDVLGSIASGVGKGEKKILCLYLAQITSALRACLAVQSSFALAWTSGALLFELIRGTHLSDKTVVRRLVRMLVTNAGLEKSEHLSLRAAVSGAVAEDVSIVTKTITLTNLARIYLLTKDISVSLDVEDSMKTAILQTLDPHLSFLKNAWRAIALDGARLMQGLKKWPKSSNATDPRRGGITYGPDIDIARLQSHYDFALPFVAAACADTKVEMNGVQPVLECILENIFVFPHNNFEHKFSLRPRKGQAVCAVRCSRATLEPLVLWGLSTMLRRRVEAAKEAEGRLLDLQEARDVERLLIFVVKDLLPSRLGLDKAMEFVFLCREITSLVSAGCAVLLHQEKLGAPEATANKSLWFWCWNSALSVLHAFFPDLFHYPDISGFNLSTHQYLRIKEVSSDSGVDTLRKICFPFLSQGPSTLPAPSSLKRIEVFIGVDINKDICQILVMLSRCPFSGGSVAAFDDYVLNVLSGLSARVVFWGAYLQIGRHDKFVEETLLMLRSFDFSNTAANNFQLFNEAVVKWVSFCASFPPGHHSWSCFRSSIEAVLLFYLRRNKSLLGEVGHLLRNFYNSIIYYFIHVCQVKSPWKVFDYLLIKSEPEPITEFLKAIQSTLFRASPEEILFFSRMLLFPGVIAVASHLIPLSTKLLFADVVLFCILNESNASAKQEILRYFLPALCILLGECASTVSDVSQIGLQLAGLAKTSQDIFKAEVARLADARKIVLQNIIKAALANDLTTNSGRTENLSKKIDLSRYRK
jgi:hypothetical protein